MGWPRKELASLCEVFTDGNWIESKDQSSDGIRLIQTGNIGEGEFKAREDKSRFISADTFSRLNCLEIFEGDCLISRLPDPVGRSCLLPKNNGRMITAVDCTVLRFKKDYLEPKFFNYYTQSQEYLNSVDSLTSGATRKRISRKNLGSVKIPVPPPKEQKRIVTILDKAFAEIEQARALAKKNLNNARELFESYLQQVFSQRGEGWVEGSLQSFVEESCSLSYGIVQPGNDFDGGLPVVRPTDLQSKFIFKEGLKLIDPSLADSYQRTALVGNELLLCVRGSTGVVSIATEELAGANVTRGIVPVRFDSSVMEQRYGYYQFISKGIQDQIKASTYGAALMQINIRDLKKLVFVAPPLKLQSMAVEKLDRIAEETEKLESVYFSKVAALDELKKSILQQAFSGQLMSKEVA